jgi:hypothetical protein
MRERRGEEQCAAGEPQREIVEGSERRTERKNKSVTLKKEVKRRTKSNRTDRRERS